MRRQTSSLRSRFNPAVIYSIVYVNCEGAVIELQIRQLSAGYSVLRFNVQGFNGASELVLVLGVQLEAAKDCIREESCCLEQSGFDWVDEPQAFEIVDLSEQELIDRNPVCVTAQSFYGNNHNDGAAYLSQSVPGGIRLLLQYDMSGCVLVRPSLSAEPIPLSGTLEAQALALFAFNGFRGALLDVMIYKHKLYIVDAIYFANTWLDDLPLSRRLGFLLDTMKLNGIDSSCVIRPMTVTATDWLMVNDHSLTRGIIARRNNSLPVYSRTALKGQGVYEPTTFLLSQQSHIRVTLLKALGPTMMIRYEDDYKVESVGALPYYYNFNEQKVSLLAKYPEPLVVF